MKKIPALFTRDGNGDLTTEYNPAAMWVANGEGIATRKWDGTAVMVRDGKLFARYDAKRLQVPGVDAGGLDRAWRILPPGFEPCQDPDPITGHWPGWVPADRPQDKWIREAAALDRGSGYPLADGTYEACGPMIGGNPEGFWSHHLLRHGAFVLDDAPRDHAGLTTYLAGGGIEGIVWWRDRNDANCDKVKITAAALGVSR